MISVGYSTMMHEMLSEEDPTHLALSAAKNPLAV
jgi:hypothetical protein